MSWKILETEAELEALTEASKTRPQVIYKHSTRCSLSSAVLHRLERSGFHPDLDFHFLDLLRFRSLSYKIAEQFGVYHESPQVLLIRNGECTYDESHMAVRMQDLVNEYLKDTKDQ